MKKIAPMDKAEKAALIVFVSSIVVSSLANDNLTRPTSAVVMIISGLIFLFAGSLIYHKLESTLKIIVNNIFAACLIVFVIVFGIVEDFSQRVFEIWRVGVSGWRQLFRLIFAPVVRFLSIAWQRAKSNRRM